MSASPTPQTPPGVRSKSRHLVLDTGAIIKGQGYSLARLAEHFWTIPEVIAEVRDPRARLHLGSLPFELRTREPSSEACKAVAGFARQTGDYSALSKVDLRVLALTYTLDAEAHGGRVDHLRTTTSIKSAADAVHGEKARGTPTEMNSVGEKPVEVEARPATEEGEAGSERVYLEVIEPDSSEEESEAEEEGEEEEGEDEEEGEEEEVVDRGKGETEETDGGVRRGDEERDAEDTTTEGVADEGGARPAPAPPSLPTPPPLHASPQGGRSWAQAVKATASRPPPPAKAMGARRRQGTDPSIPFQALTMEETARVGPRPALSRVVEGRAGEHGGVTSRIIGGAGQEALGLASGTREEVDDEEGWIHTGNLTSVRAKGVESVFGPRGGTGPTQDRDGVMEPSLPLVACVTTDFAMQNVMLQMGLRLMSLEGAAVTRVKQWARRCESCAKLVHDQDRMFCPRCGNAYLSRVSISLDSATGQLRVHLSKLWRPRPGCKYSIPKPGKGKASRWEGDLLLREDQLQMGIWQQKMKRRTKMLDSMFGADITETLGVAVTKSTAANGIQFGYGRKNPNSQRGRERRGKRKKKN